MDEEVSKELAKTFSKRKIQLLTGTKVENIEKTKGKVIVHVSSAGDLEKIEAENLEYDEELAKIGKEEKQTKLETK